MLKQIIDATYLATKSRKVKAALATLVMTVFPLLVDNPKLAGVVGIAGVALIGSITLMDIGKDAVGLGPGEGLSVVPKVAGWVVTVITAALVQQLCAAFGAPEIADSAMITVGGLGSALLLSFGLSQQGVNLRKLAAGGALLLFTAGCSAGNGIADFVRATGISICPEWKVSAEVHPGSGGAGGAGGADGEGGAVYE